MKHSTASTLPTATPVFIHGAGSSSDFWHEQLPAFPGALYLDLPGHAGGRGKVPKNAGLRSVDEYASWVAGRVEEEGLSRVVLNGHSMGGAITLTLALQHPVWLAGIVLTGTGARLRVLSSLQQLLRTDYSAAVDLIIHQSFAPVPEPLTYKQKLKLNGARRHLLRTPQYVTAGDYEACDRFDVMQQIGDIAVPTLCIVGAQDTMTPLKYSEYLHSRIAGSRLAVIEGAGHMLPLEQPEQYNLHVADFLATLPRGDSRC